MAIVAVCCFDIAHPSTLSAAFTQLKACFPIDTADSGSVWHAHMVMELCSDGTRASVHPHALTS